MDRKRAKVDKWQVLLVAVAMLIMVASTIRILNQPVLSPEYYLPSYDEVLSPKVSDYLAKNAGGIYNTEQYDANGNLLHGRGDNYCKALIYGHDEKYIYAHVVCQEYCWNYHYNLMHDTEDTVTITRSLLKGTGWSSHLRLEYIPGTDFKIIGYRNPRSGYTYGSDLVEMFAPIGSKGAVDMDLQPSIYDELLASFRNDHSDDPYPDQIREIYAVHNPKVVIGGEV